MDDFNIILLKNESFYWFNCFFSIDLQSYIVNYTTNTSKIHKYNMLSKPNN